MTGGTQMGPTLPDTLLHEPSLNAWVISLPHKSCPDGRKEVLAKMHEPRYPGSKRNEGGRGRGRGWGRKCAGDLGGEGMNY